MMLNLCPYMNIDLLLMPRQSIHAQPQFPRIYLFLFLIFPIGRFSLVHPLSAGLAAMDVS